MVIGCCSVKFYLHGNNSLKGKRRVIRAIKDRVKNGFNVREIPVQMRERSAGQPSNRNFRLIYYFLRLLIVIFVGSRRKTKGKA